MASSLATAMSGQVRIHYPLRHLPGSRRFASAGRIPLPIPNLRQVLAVLVDLSLVLDQLVLELPLEFNSSCSPRRV